MQQRASPTRGPAPSFPSSSAQPQAIKNGTKQTQTDQHIARRQVTRHTQRGAQSRDRDVTVLSIARHLLRPPENTRNSETFLRLQSLPIPFHSPSNFPSIILQLSLDYPSLRFNSLQFDLATPVMKSTDADTGADSINKSAPTTSIKTGVAALNRNLQFHFVLIYRRWSDGVDGVNQRRQRRQRRQRHAISSFSINATWLFNRPINRRPIPSETDSG